MSELLLNSRYEFEKYVNSFPYSEDKLQAEKEKKLVELIKSKVFGEDPPNLPANFFLVEEDESLQMSVDKLTKSTNELLTDGIQCQTECYARLRKFWTEKLKRRSDAILESVNLENENDKLDLPDDLTKQIVSNLQELDQLCDTDNLQRRQSAFEKSDNISKILVKRNTRSRTEKIIDEEISKKRQKK